MAAIRRLIPVKPDGTEDKHRAAIFIGHTQLMSPEGPIPIQAPLKVNSLEKALPVFPEAMKQALDEMLERIKKMKQQQQAKQRDASRIIVPGR